MKVELYFGIDKDRNGESISIGKRIAARELLYIELTRAFDGFTYFDVTGSYKKVDEESLLVIIVTSESREKVIAKLQPIITDFLLATNQESVLVNLIECESRFETIKI